MSSPLTVFVFSAKYKKWDLRDSLSPFPTIESHFSLSTCWFPDWDRPPKAPLAGLSWDPWAPVAWPKFGSALGRRPR